MRKLLQVFLVLAFVMASCASTYALESQPTWYKLDDKVSVLTITLPANETTGYAWEYVISDPEAFELVTEEYVQDESTEGMAGVGGTWVANFIGVKAGNVELTLNYKRSWEDEAAETRLVKLFVSENNHLEVVAADMIPAAQPDWYELSEDETVLTVALPANATTGYEWDYMISDPEAFEMVTEEYVQGKGSEDREGAGGTWVASFMGTFKKSGSADLTLNYKRSWEDEAAETRLVSVLISEDNHLKVISADSTVRAVKQ